MSTFKAIIGRISTNSTHIPRKRCIVPVPDSNKSAQLVISSDQLDGKYIQVYTGKKKILEGVNHKYVELWAY